MNSKKDFYGCEGYELNEQNEDRISRYDTVDPSIWYN